MNNVVKSIGTLVLLGICAIPAGLIVILAQLIIPFKKPKNSTGRTVLLSGGKMTKCLQLARMFYQSGDRVIIAETPLYKYSGSRYSRAVSKFISIPDIEDDGMDFCQALADIAYVYEADLFIPVSSPKSAFYEALAKPLFPETTEVFQFDAEVIKKLDDKHQFIKLSGEYGLSVPESFHIESQEQILSHKFTDDKRYILKKLDYDPVYRLDLRTLPHDGWEDRVRSLPIDKDNPWVLQEFIEGVEICTHTTTQNGEMNLYVCSDSSPFQVNYEMKYLPQVEDWVQTFVSKLQGTGQVSFDFILDHSGIVMPIECNPRTHSAITLFHDQLDAAAAYYSNGDNKITYTPREKTAPTFWIYHELHRLFVLENFTTIPEILKGIWNGKEAIFNWNDPLPFFYSNHVNIPYQIIQCLKNRQEWSHIDFNIGKLAIQGGD